MNNWTKELLDKFNKMIIIKNRGGRINGTEITNIYNQVLDKQLKPTNCGSCITQRFQELKKLYDLYLLEQVKALEAIDEMMLEDEKPKITRKKKKDE